ncbi:hypothetical protein CapIbe_000732 [Capra ibex]
MSKDKHSGLAHEFVHYAAREKSDYRSCPSHVLSAVPSTGPGAGYKVRNPGPLRPEAASRTPPPRELASGDPASQLLALGRDAAEARLARCPRKGWGCGEGDPPEERTLPRRRIRPLAGR